MERRASQRERELASRLLIAESGHDGGPESYMIALTRAFEKLHRGLAYIVGPAGFDAMAERALHLAGTECPFLRSVRYIRTNDTVDFDGLSASVSASSDAEVRSAAIAVLANFFWLIATFIGEDLKRRLIQPIWPAVDFAGPDLGAESKDG